MTFVPAAGPADAFSRINPERCWADDEGGYGWCPHVPCTSLGLCASHLEEFREASREVRLP